MGLKLTHEINQGAQVFLYRTPHDYFPTNIVCVDVVCTQITHSTRGTSAFFEIYHKNKFTRKTDDYLASFQVELKLSEIKMISEDIKLRFVKLHSKPQTHFPEAGLEYIVSNDWCIARGKYENGLFVPGYYKYEQKEEAWIKEQIEYPELKSLIKLQ